MKKNDELKSDWRKVRISFQEFERKILAVLRHPEVTLDQLHEARRAYINAYESMLKVQDKLITQCGNGVYKFNQGGV